MSNKIRVSLAAQDPEDTVHMNVPPFIRCLEYARESVKTD